MTAITIPRTTAPLKKSSSQCASALGARYHVLPGNVAASFCVAPRQDQADAIAVSTGFRPPVAHLGMQPPAAAAKGTSGQPRPAPLWSGSPNTPAITCEERSAQPSRIEQADVPDQSCQPWQIERPKTPAEQHAADMRRGMLLVPCHDRGGGRSARQPGQQQVLAAPGLGRPLEATK